MHGNGFYHYDIEGSYDTTAWADGDNEGNSDNSYTPQVMQGSWVTLASNLEMNGYGSGMSEGSVLTNTFSNDVNYRKYRVIIRDMTPSGGQGGWAVYTWKWDRI